LTFFYRQMLPLIERGYIYIGLPPLYKIKQGRNELYIKDDGALNAYLVNNAVDAAELVYAPSVPALAGTGLEKLLADYQASQAIVDRLSQRYDTQVLTAMLDTPPMSAGQLTNTEA